MAEEQADEGAMDVDVEQQDVAFFGRGSVTRPAADGDEAVRVRRSQPRVVASQKLAEAIGQGPLLVNGDAQGDEGQEAAGALPSVREMFDRVVGLFWGKGDGRDE